MLSPFLHHASALEVTPEFQVPLIRRRQKDLKFQLRPSPMRPVRGKSRSGDFAEVADRHPVHKKGSNNSRHTRHCHPS
jgi:hypothetical protein